MQEENLHADAWEMNFLRVAFIIMWIWNLHISCTGDQYHIPFMQFPCVQIAFYPYQNYSNSFVKSHIFYKKFYKILNFILNSEGLYIKMIKYQLYLHLTTSTWPKKNFKNTCHNLVKILFLLSQYKMHAFCIKNRKHKSTGISTLNLYYTLYNRRN